jgi:pimeloyl-ACP methyl ester carboxylesterase
MSTQLSQGVAHSADGTSIGYIKLGTGPGLVIVHGSLTTGDEWLPVASALADRFTSYLMDRRGRGRSGDGEGYSLSKECEDIKAVLDAAGPDSFLLGHSYGAICALEAARRFPVSALVLYEPPLPIHETIIGPAFKDFRSAVDRNELDEALTIGLRDLVRMSSDEIAGLRRTPFWTGMAALTPTWTRECEAIDLLKLGVSRFAGMASPTLLLVGTATAPHHIEASRDAERKAE